ncbi:MAG TPA: hypothetical protein VHB79_06875 [Polyangiaceae bacterium]|nr:hypothetical protein [Polyangiaceae bacterium]
MATESDNVNSGALGTLLSVGAVATLGIALVVTALVRTEVAEEHDKKDVSADRPLLDLVAEQKAKMNAPAAYVDRGRGLVSLPIERAMELVVGNLKKDPNSATPPAPAAAGSGGSGGEAAAAGGSGGTGGSGGEAAAAGGTAGAEAAPANEAIHAEGGKAATEPTKEEKGEKKDDKKKDGAKPKPVPAAPAPAPAPAAPAPAPAPNGQ